MEKVAQLKSFEIQGLFGIYNHKITLSENGVTIIIGKNGIGKTYLLESINRFFSLEWEYFIELDFKKIVVSFSNDTSLDIIVDKCEDGRCLKIERTTFDRDGEVVETKQYISPSLKDYSFRRDGYNDLEMIREILQYFPSIKRINPRYYLDIDTREYFDKRQLMDKFGSMLNMTRIYKKVDEVDGELRKLIEVNNVKLIETQRIYDFSQEGTSTIENVQKNANYLKQLMEQADKEYNKKSVELDSKFVFNLVELFKDSSNSKVNPNKLLTEFEELTSRRKKLEEIGLLDNEKRKFREINEYDIKKAPEAIELYIKNTSEKFNVYSSIEKKIKLFKEIVDKRFENKEMVVNKDEGYEFKSKLVIDSEKKIPVSKLSSGEKNELILFFQLIFLTDKGMTLLIDEPEISLHIDWQNKFIQDVEKIVNENQLSVIIATHSPDIVNDKWDLVVDLSDGEV